MKNVNNRKKVQGSTDIDWVNIIGCKCDSCDSFRASTTPSEAQLEAADRIVTQLAGIIARVKGRA